MNSRVTVWCVILSCMVGLSGCASTNIFKFPESIPKEDQRHPVGRILTLWQPSEGRWNDRTTRGAAGQIYFFGLNGDSPMQVDGEAVIQVFDDRGTPEEQAQPIHEFRFDRDAWKAHRVKGPLGATYDVFIPYTPRGQTGNKNDIYEAKMTLLVKYVSRTGARLDSGLIEVPLEGVKRAAAAKPEPAEYGRDSGLARDSAKPALASSHDAGRHRPTRGADLTMAMPTAEELDRVRGKIKADAPLNAQERKRILRGARDQQALDEPSHVRHASYEERAVETAGSAADDDEFDDLPQRRSKAAPSDEDRVSEISDDDWE